MLEREGCVLCDPQLPPLGGALLLAAKAGGITGIAEGLKIGAVALRFLESDSISFLPLMICKNGTDIVYCFIDFSTIIAACSKLCQETKNTFLRV